MQNTVAVYIADGLDDTSVSTSESSGEVAEGSSVEIASEARLTIGREGSEVYTYVKLVGTRYRCSLCASAEHSGWGTRNTSNFWGHLQSKHLKEYQELVGADTLSEASSFNQEVASKVLTEWVIADYHPFSLVEQRGFREFCKVLQPLYQPPCRKTFRERVIKCWLEHKIQVRGKLLHDLQGGRRASLTADLWTSSAKRGYLVVTLHYIDDQWDMRSVILGFTRLVYPHSGSRLGRGLIYAVTDMDKGLLSSLWTVTADNASNNPAMVNEINLQLQQRLANCDSPPRQVVYLRCIAHVLQLAVKEGLKCCPDLNNALGGLREVVKRLQESPKLLERYADVCATLNVDGATESERFKLDVETCWNSTYDMINHLLKCKPRLEELIRRILGRHVGYVDLSIDIAISIHITPESWKCAELYRSFLDRFKDATVLLSGTTYPTMGLVASVYRSIKLHVDRAVKAQEKEVQRLNVMASTSAQAVSAEAQSRATVALKFFKGARRRSCGHSLRKLGPRVARDGREHNHASSAKRFSV